MYLTNLLKNNFFSESYENMLAMDNSVIKENFENNIFKYFQIDLNKWFEIEFILVFKANLSITEIDNMEYYRVQYFLKYYQEYLDAEHKKEEEENSKYDGKKNMFNTNNLTKNASKMLLTQSGPMKMPNMNSFKL